MTIREEIQHLSSNELNKVYDLLVKCLEILNPDDESLLDLSSNGKDMTFQIKLAKAAILSRIIELDQLDNIGERLQSQTPIKVDEDGNISFGKTCKVM